MPARVALGALLIKERRGLTDRETVETIGENPYLQFFLGKEEFSSTDCSKLPGRCRSVGFLAGSTKIGWSLANCFVRQLEMFESNSQRVDDRIVSISQPHVRPIVRGKAGRPTEFGAKLSISVVNGFSFVDRLSWNSYNEGTDLIEQIATYRRRFGCYPESAHVDKMYRKELSRFIARAPIERFASNMGFE